MTTSKTTRLQDHTNHKGLALCGHVTLDVTARWWVPTNTHGTPAPQRREAVGGPKLHKRLQAANKTRTLPLQEQTPGGENRFNIFNNPVRVLSCARDTSSCFHVPQHTWNASAQNARRHDSKHTNNHTKKGWFFASGSSWTLGHTGGSRQDTHGTPVPLRRKAVARRNLHEDDNRRQDTGKLQDNRLATIRCWHALVILHGSGAGSRNRRSTESCQTVSTRSKWRRPGSSRRSPWMRSTRRRSTTRPITSSFRRNSTRKKLLMWLLWQRKLSLRFKTMHRKIRRKRLNKGIWVGPPTQWTCKLTFSERHWKWKLTQESSWTRAICKSRECRFEQTFV